MITRFFTLGRSCIFAYHVRPATLDQHWAQGVSVALQVLNLFDRRQSVQGSSAVTRAGYLDPVGRTVWFTACKSFE